MPYFSGERLLKFLPDYCGRLPLVIGYLDTIKNDINSINGELIISSFMYMVTDSLKLDPVENDYLYTYWNKMMWPLKYKDLRSMADYQNQIFEAYAKKNDLEFFDLSKDMPMDPNLFIDGIHIREEAVPLRAWITFMQLLPVIRQRLETGALPKAAFCKYKTHPEFNSPPSLQVILKCDCPPRQKRNDPYCLNHF